MERHRSQVGCVFFDVRFLVRCEKTTGQVETPRLNDGRAQSSIAPHIVRTILSSREQGILLSEILSNIAVPKTHHSRRIQFSRLGRAPCRDAKP